MSEREFNPEQLQAINYGEGPLMIIAGAGTGKTTVITERIKNIISEGFAKPSEILALTFTEKAATEMETRIDEALPLGYSQLTVTTFHGFCDRVLRESAIHIGLDPKYKLLTSAESLDFLRSNLFDLGLSYFKPLGNPSKFLFGLLSHFSRLQDENINPEEYLDWSKNYAKSKPKDKEEELEIIKYQELSQAFKKYDELKIQNSFLDFGDLIAKTLLLFNSRPNILSEYRRRFRFILVDEFQDTNYSQNELVKFLSGDCGNITVVLDDDQSIYRFRGAAVSNALQFRSVFPTSQLVTLTKNYRSYQEILDYSYALISHNNPDRLEVIEGINKRLTAVRKGKGKLKLEVSTTASEEADYVSKKILEITSKGKYNYSDCAILVRANNYADSFIRSFEEHQIPFQFLGPGKLFEQPEISTLISYLRFLTNIEDSQSFYKILLLEEFEVDPLDIARLMSISHKRSESLFEIALSVSEISEIKDDSKQKIQKLTEKIKSDLKDLGAKKAGDILYSFVNESGVLKKAMQNPSSESQLIAENVAKFFEKVKLFEVNQKNASVWSVLNWIELQTELGESPMAGEIDISTVEGVKILTVHSSKGLEFPVVFLVNLVGQRFPSMERREQIPIPNALIKESLPSGDFHLQEERRLFYVGLTRARDMLFLTAAKYYGDAKREKKLSPFISETLGEKNAANASSKNIQIKKKDEEQIPVKNIEVTYLSYSQIETFKICPLHYKLHYLLKVPTNPSPSQSFGNSIHKTLKYFYDSLKEGTRVTEPHLFELLSKNWIKEGYENKQHAKQAYETAQKYIKVFFDNYYSPNTQTIALEVPFKFSLGDLTVGGVIDRIDKDGDTLHIIDYKTGENILSQKEADTNLQLSIYALAATRLKETPFGVSPEKVKLSLVYFSDPQIVATYRTQKDLGSAAEEIKNWREKIQTSDFSCNNPFFCTNCEYKTFCKSEIDS